jgi:hypothetical protein
MQIQIFKLVNSSGASYHVNQIVRDYVNAQKEWLTIIHLPKKARYINPNDQQIKSDVCANRFYEYIEELKDKVSEYEVLWNTLKIV